jgi:hypothetical protein
MVSAASFAPSLTHEALQRADTNAIVETLSVTSEHGKCDS